MQDPQNIFRKGDYLSNIHCLRCETSSHHVVLLYMPALLSMYEMFGSNLKPKTFQDPLSLTKIHDSKTYS